MFLLGKKSLGKCLNLRERVNVFLIDFLLNDSLSASLFSNLLSIDSSSYFQHPFSCICSNEWYTSRILSKCNDMDPYLLIH